MTATTQKGHPSGLYMLFTVEMWERFSYYSMRAIFVLFLVQSIPKGGLGWSEEAAQEFYGWFQGFVYLTPLLGGFLADRYLGKRVSVVIGGFLMMFGHFFLGSGLGEIPFFFGVFLLTMGNGFFKPNISSIVGELYEPGDARRDGAFTIFYMGINVGAFISGFAMSYFQENDMLNWGFIVAGLGMLVGQIIYLSTSKKMLGEIGKKPKKEKTAEGAAPKKALTKIEKDRILVIFILALFSMFFWAGFEQAGSSFNLFTDKYVDRNVGGVEIGTTIFQSVNPLFIITLAFPFSFMWSWFASQGKEVATPVKMAIGLILLGIGFILVVFACFERGEGLGVIIEDEAVKASVMWIFLVYLLHTMAELCISPIGLSMITKLAPAHMVSLFMGVWFGSIFIANVLGGYIAKFSTSMGRVEIWGGVAVVTILGGLLLLLFSRKLIKLMHGIK